MTTEQAIAAALGTYVAARADRIATDVGLLTIQEDRGLGVLLVHLNGEPYVVAIVVRRAP